VGKNTPTPNEKRKSMGYKYLILNGLKLSHHRQTIGFGYYLRGV
jgi:hypothetical protein